MQPFTPTIVALNAKEKTGDEPPAASTTLRQAYIRRHAEMRQFLRRRTGDADAADELVQDVWEHIAEIADEPDHENPDGLLQRIIVVLALKWQRRRHLHPIFDDPDILYENLLDDAPDAERALHAKRGISYLGQLIDELPPKKRAVYVLYRGRGLSLKQTADQLGISVKTVKAHMSQTMHFLRQRMLDAGLWP
jgi:RNA polymerase sigma factor (sigma-70 family)